jgi:hypothetical protein
LTLHTAAARPAGLPHDNGVPHLLVIDGRVEAEAVRDLLVARVAQDGAAPQMSTGTSAT